MQTAGIQIQFTAQIRAVCIWNFGLDSLLQCTNGKGRTERQWDLAGHTLNVIRSRSNPSPYLQALGQEELVAGQPGRCNLWPWGMLSGVAEEMTTFVFSPDAHEWVQDSGRIWGLLLLLSTKRTASAGRRRSRDFLPLWLVWLIVIDQC